MKKIRQNVFETNSSSTHSICIAKDVELELPESIHFEFGEFGWENDTLYSMWEKASYLYTGFIANNRQEDFNNIVTILENKGIEVTYEEPIYSKHSYKDGDRVIEYTHCDNGGYIDHSYELIDFLNDIYSDETKLLNFLFSSLSFIITGNDNDDYDVDINVSYSYDEYYKGN